MTLGPVRAWWGPRRRAVARTVGVAYRAVGTALAPIGRRAPEIVVSIGLVLSVLAALVLVGAARNDATIDADRGEAVAEVLDGSSARLTFIRFTAADGAVLTPEHGVFYPRGLEPGDLVRVEYDRAEPELVRVAGRDWTEGLLPVVLGIVVLWVVLVPVVVLLVRARRRRIAAAAAAVPTPPVRTPVGAGAP